MKRFVYAAAAIVLTGVLVLLAMAVAQRDARLSDGSAIQNELPYANQPAQPIDGSIADGFGNENSAGNDWPPAPIVRGNDSPPPSHFPSANFPETRPSPNALTSYSDQGLLPTGTNESSGIVRMPTSSGRLAEPPPLSALNSFPTPIGNSAGPGLQSNPYATLPNSLPTTLPSTLPSQPYSSPNLPYSGPGTLPSERFNPAVATPSNTDPSLGSQSLGSQSKLTDLNSAESSSLPPSNFASTLPQSPSYPPVSNPQSNAPIATLGMPMNPNAVPSALPKLPSSPLPSSQLSSSQLSSSPYSSPVIESPTSFAPNASSTTKPVGFSSASPGMRLLDGSQNPSMEIQKRAPSEVQVGIPATFTLLVRNVGNATAFDVHVVDSIPKGAKLVRTSPQAQPNGPNGLSWKLGEMAAGAEQTITIELVPESEGEIGSVASVNFAVQASVRTMSTQPKLVVKQLMEPLVLGGESVKIRIDVSNAGTGTARNVRLEEDVPQNMRHASGAKVLELSVGDLAPGESQKFDIELTAVSAGKVSNILRAVAENAAVNESATPIEVVSPKLQIGIEGPKLRYLERQATYTASITNTGTAMATDILLICHLPSGLQFNSAENLGEYIPNQHAVMWRLAELASGKSVATKFTLMPVEEGDFVLRMQADAQSIRAEAVEKPVRVEGQSELAFSIEDDNDPIETDGKTTYVIKIVNTGTRVDNDVQLQIDLPDGAIVEQVDAPVSYQTSQKAVQFAPIPQMKSKDQTTIRIAVRHTREGTHVLRAQLKSKLRPGAVIKEESTQVYRDQ